LRALPCTRKYTTSDDFQVKDDSIGRDALCPSTKIQKQAAFGITALRVEFVFLSAVIDAPLQASSSLAILQIVNLASAG